MALEVIYYQNDMLLELTGLQDATDDSYINDATVAVTITDIESGDEISGQSWPTSLSYVAGSNGNYRATIENDISVALGQRLRADITVSASEGTARFQPELVVNRRT